ncbi:MAG: hypothetical protein JKY71_00710 [Alphaproteobacteria bacterium]|nr:hypothetical protein [Alphaproteobacteria bacterium]
MDWGLIISSLYSLVPIIGVTAYGPQILAILKTESLQNFPFSTWAIWLFTGSVSFVYGTFKLQDLLFSITALSNVVPIAIIMALAAYKSGFFLRRICANRLSEQFAVLTVDKAKKPYSIYEN